MLSLLSLLFIFFPCAEAGNLLLISGEVGVKVSPLLPQRRSGPVNMTVPIPSYAYIDSPTGPLASLEMVLFFLEQRGGLGVNPGHHRRVRELSIRLGQQLGLSQAELNQLATAALFHDLGQLALPDGLLRTPGRLTPSDYEIVKTHPLHTLQILQPVISEEPVLLAIRHHHEQFGGGGYPDKLEGDQIPFLARILAVPEVFDAMVHRRPWREPLTVEKVRELVAQYRGSLFDPQIIDAFMSLDRHWLLEYFTEPLHAGGER